MTTDKLQDAAFSAGQEIPAGEEIREDLTVEEAFGQLEGLIGRMEAEGITLEESFACYEKGIRLIKYCNDRIDRVEKKVQMLRGEGQAPMDGAAGGSLE